MKEQLEKLIQQEVDAGEVAGANVYVEQAGNVLYEASFGYQDMDSKTSVHRDTIFRLYSLTKPITAVAVMILWERGMIELTDPVSRYLEGFKNQCVWQEGELEAVQREVTIQDLLDMRSGLMYPEESTAVGCLTDEVFENAIRRAKEGMGYGTVEFCNQIGKLPLAFQPGERWLYGSSADILGGIVEVVTKKKYSQFLKEELFVPLGMVDTDFYVPEEKWHRFATMYQYTQKEPKLTPYTGSNLVILDYKRPPEFESGGAGLVSTISDYARFAKMLLNKGVFEGKRYLKEETVTYLSADHLNEEQRKAIDWENLKGHSYCNLMRILVDKEEWNKSGSVGEFGWDGWAGVYVIMDPEKELVLLYFISRIDKENDTLRNQIRDIVYDSLS